MNSNIIYVAFGGNDGKKGGKSSSDLTGEEKETGKADQPVSSKDIGSGFHLQGDHRSLVDLYTREQVSHLIGVSVGRLKWWEKCGLIKPSRKYGREKFYTFENLIAVRAAKELTEKGCKASRIKKAIKKLCEQIPEADRPLTRMKVCGNDSRLIIEREGKDVEIESGQILIDFSVSSVVKQIQETVVSSKGGRKSRGRKSAYDWFLEGIHLEDKEGPVSWTEAENAYRKALELEPEMAPAMTNLGNIKYRRGELKEAEQYYRNAIKDDPYLPQPYYNLGCLKLEGGRPDIAMIYLRKAQELDPEFADVYFHLALALEKEGRRGEALDQFKKFLEFEGDSAWSKIARQHIQQLK